jgi:hypothetical protein
MKTSHISLILVSVFLFGCSATSPKKSSVTKTDVSPLGLRSPDNVDQYRISLEIGLRYDAPGLLEGLRPHQSTVAPSSIDNIGLDYGKRDMRLSGDNATINDEQYWASLKIISRCYTPSLVFNGSPPHQTQIIVSSGNSIRLDCRGRDMSLIDDTASK